MRATVCFPCSRLHPVSLGRRISEQKEGGLTSSRQRRATSRSHRCACALFPCPRRGPTSCSLSVRRAATILLIHAGPPGRCLYVPGSERRSQPCEQPRGRTRAKEESLELTVRLRIEALRVLAVTSTSRTAVHEQNWLALQRIVEVRDTVSPLRRWGSAERPRKGLQRLAFWFPYCLTWILCRSDTARCSDL